MADRNGYSSHMEKFGNFKDNDEEHDNTPEEIHEAIYVKTISGKTISTRYYRNMKQQLSYWKKSRDEHWSRET